MQCPNHPRDMDCPVGRCRKCDAEAAATDQAAGAAAVKAELRQYRPPAPTKAEATRQAALDQSREARHAQLVKLIDGGDRR